MKYSILEELDDARRKHREQATPVSLEALKELREWVELIGPWAHPFLSSERRVKRLTDYETRLDTIDALIAAHEDNRKEGK